MGVRDPDRQVGVIEEAEAPASGARRAAEERDD